MISTVDFARVVRCAGFLLLLAVFFEGVGVRGAALWPRDDKSKSSGKQQADEKKAQHRAIIPPPRLPGLAPH